MKKNSAVIKRLQRQIDLVLPWFKQWKITVNSTKTTAIMFINRSMYEEKEVKFGNASIKWSDSVKYLRIIISLKLSFTNQIKTAIRKAKGAKLFLYPFINQLSSLQLRTKIYFYKTYIWLIILYAVPAWSRNILDSSWKKLEPLQTTTLTTLKWILRSDWYVTNHTIRTLFNIPLIKETISNDKKVLIERIENSNYNHISNITKRANHKELFFKRLLS